MQRNNYLICGLVLVLSACTEGTDSQGKGFTDFTSVPADGSYTINGTARTAKYTANLNTGAVTVGTVSGPKAATVTITNVAGQTVAEQLSTDGSSASFDTRKGDQAFQSDGVNIIAGADLQTVVVQTVPGEAGYNYQSFGAWLTGYGTGAGTVGVASVGSVSPVSGVPKVGNATYNGNSVGLAQDPAGNSYVSASNIQVTTDFKTATIRSTGTELIDINTGDSKTASNLDFNGVSAVAGSGFHGTITGSAGIGNVDAKFYGPTAQEVGGTFGLTASDYSYAGSFGGK